MTAHRDPKTTSPGKRQSRPRHADIDVPVAKDPETDSYINLAGIYDYLSDGYYLSQDYEHTDRRIKPTCKDMLDAYVPPLCLEKAKQAGIPIPEYYVSNGYFEPPVIVDPVNPFTLKGKLVRGSGRARSTGKSLTRNYTYAICCQELPEGAKLVYFQSVLGWSVKPAYRPIARQVWDVFSIPLARVRLIHTRTGEYLLSDIAPLSIEDLSGRATKYLEEHVKWDH